MQVVPVLTHRCLEVFMTAVLQMANLEVMKSFSPWHKPEAIFMQGVICLNSTGGPAGWAPTSNTSAVYRRCMTYSVRPVIDPDVQEDYKKYLPE